MKVAAIVGSTASGKTSVAIEAALALSGEIISCDSMQVYKGMNIGTAKATLDERRNIPHYMIDIADPGVNFSVNEYSEMAKAYIRDISSRGKLPIMCGGTGLYLDSTLTCNRFSNAKTDEILRAELSMRSPSELYEELKKVDPDSSSAIHPNNVKRVIRALEIYYTTGINKTEWDRKSRTETGEFESVIIGLDFADRNILYRRINERVDKMIENGLVDEVRNLNLIDGTTASQAIGYKEIIDCLNGKITLEKAIEEIKTATRHYCKRQLTWFKRNKSIYWVNMEQSFKDIVNNIIKHLKN